MLHALSYIAFFLMATVLADCMGGSSVSYERPSPTGTGGSMARFTIAGDYLYTVDNTKLNLFNISTPSEPQKEKEISVGVGVETIFPYEDKLFIGTQTGMHIFNISNPALPKQVSHYWHTFSCDPVVTDGRYAYITLSSGTACGRTINELHIVDLQELNNPRLVRQYNMTNPKGLAIDNSTLFLCDDGLKVFDAKDPKNLKQTAYYNIKAFDVISHRGKLLVIGSDGLYQYLYHNNDLELLSKISVANNQ